MKMIEEIRKGLRRASEKAGIEDPAVHIEHPDELTHGDFSSNVALVYSKKLKTGAKELAERIIEEFMRYPPESVDSVSLAGPGFININLSRKYFVKSIQEILERENDYGRQEIGKGKTILAEYSSPNIAKPFTVGHLRSTIIGDAIANILDSLGYTVVRDNHLGDWGTQFGKLLVALEKWGDIGKIEKSESPIKDLAGLYVRFHTEAENDNSLEDMARVKFQELENGGNGEIQEIWKKCIDLSKKEFERIYEQLG
ncbi:MAG: arginine--tRNA ligase, partial [bacterium]|nr:arginine--tRNA ligase [bacterium]